MTEREAPPKVYEALIKAQELLGAVGISKDRTNAFDKSKFRGIDDVYNAVSSALVKARLNVRPTKIERIREERPKGDKVTTITIVEVTYTFTSADDGSSCAAVMHAEGVDTSDKSTGKAMSYCYKQLMFQTFAIPIEGHSTDPDDDKPEVPAKQQAQRPASDARPQTSQPATNNARYALYWALFKNSSHVGQPVAELQDTDLAAYIMRLEKAVESKGTDPAKPYPYKADAEKYLEVAQRVLKSRMPEDEQPSV